MRTFDTGATRDTTEGKLDYHEYLSTAVLRRYAQYMLSKQVQPDGEKRPGDNWKKGIPTDAYMASMARHFVDVMMFHEGRFTPDSVAEEGMTLETALCAMLFNVMGYLDNLLIKQEGKAEEVAICEIPHRTIAEEDLCEARRLKARKAPSPDAELDPVLGPVRRPSGEVIQDADGAVTVVPVNPDGPNTYARRPAWAIDNYPGVPSGY